MMALKQIHFDMTEVPQLPSSQQQFKLEEKFAS